MKDGVLENVKEAKHSSNFIEERAGHTVEEHGEAGEAGHGEAGHDEEGRRSRRGARRGRDRGR